MLTPQQVVRTFFFFIRGETAFSPVQFTVPVFLDFTLYKTLELRGIKSGGFTKDEPSRGSVNEPVDHSRAVRSVTDCRHCKNCPAFYLNVLILFLCIRLLFNYVQLARRFE